MESPSFSSQLGQVEDGMPSVFGHFRIVTELFVFLDGAVSQRIRNPYGKIELNAIILEINA